MLRLSHENATPPLVIVGFPWITRTVLFLTLAPHLLGQQDRMNIITVFTDDQAEWTVGAYGNSEVITPHIDRLARQGARFSNAFVATPVCSPSRATSLTGLYSTRMGITDYISQGPGFEAEAGSI